MIVRSPQGKIYGGFDAARVLAWALPAGWLFIPLLYFPGVALIGRPVYHMVARNRFRLISCDDGVCSIHLMALSRSDLQEEEITRIVQNAREMAEAKKKAAEG